jgi:uncharacterized protein YdeI (YjbR/CyaY-like superfamily)
MPTLDPRVDAYIARQADFARPILTHIRALVHARSPEIGEAIKWEMPFFVYRDRNLCHMAGFKAYAAFGLWRGREIAGDASGDREEAMGQFGRIAALADLPSDQEMASLLAEAMARIDAGPVPSKAKPALRAPLETPPELTAAIAAHPDAARHWGTFTPGKVRDYAEWIGEAKRAETRDKRIAQAVEWIAEGKDRNWKYR